MTKTIFAAVALLVALTACGSTNTAKYEMDCREAGGEVTHVAEQYTCIKDGVKIAEWTKYE